MRDRLIHQLVNHPEGESTQVSPLFLNISLRKMLGNSHKPADQPLHRRQISLQLGLE